MATALLQALFPKRCEVAAEMDIQACFDLEGVPHLFTELRGANILVPCALWQLCKSINLYLRVPMSSQSDGYNFVREAE